MKLYLPLYLLKRNPGKRLVLLVLRKHYNYFYAGYPPPPLQRLETLLGEPKLIKPIILKRPETGPR